MKNKKNIFYCFSIFLIYMIISLILYFKLILQLYPIGDEFSIIQSSTNIDIKWIFSGFSDYFVVYPEFPKISTDYIRPVTNLIYWIFSPWNVDLFRLQLILTNHAFHAATSTFIFYISYVYFKRKLNYSIAVSSIVYFSAAFFNSPMPYQPVFVIECIAAVLCLLAIYSYSNEKYVVCIILIFISILTKESALPVIGGLILYSIITRKTKILISLIGIIIIWLTLRYIAYNGFGNTATFSSGFRITNIISTSMLPLAFFDVSTLKGFITIDAVPIRTSFFLSLNILFWCLFSFFMVKNFLNKNYKIKISRNEIIVKNEIEIISLLCILTTATYIAITGVSTGRFTYLFIVVLSLYLISVKNTLLTALSIFLLLMSIFGSILSFFDLNKDMLIQKFISSKELVHIIGQNGMNVENIYIANDFSSGFSSPIYQKNFVGINSEIIRITSIDCDKCSPSDISAVETSVRRENEFSYIDTKLPECAVFVFESTDMDKLNIDIDNTIKRDDKISYIFPELEYTTAIMTGKKHLYTLGQSVSVKIKDGNIIIYYDFKNKKWKIF